MPKRGSKKNTRVSKPDSDVEIISRMKIKFEDTKAITGVSPEFKWGELYQIIIDQNVLNAGHKEMFLYQNIKNSGITKASTRAELFLFSEVIRWILPQINSSTRIISNIKGKAFSSFTPSYITSPASYPMHRL